MSGDKFGRFRDSAGTIRCPAFRDADFVFTDETLPRHALDWPVPITSAQAAQMAKVQRLRERRGEYP